VVHPVFKSGKRNDIKNYRGITILSVLPKLFESMVHRILSFHLKRSIIPEQHGFYSGRSTVTNLVAFCGDLFKSTNSRLQLDVIYTDFAKAFDKIDHQILSDKLEKLNCKFVPMKWLLSYLSDRWQFVKCVDSASHLFRATSGVPQGSHIGPLLFTIFVNDVIDCFEFAKCLLFADDMKIFATVANVFDCNKLQNDLNRLSNWSTSNKLLLNVSKCKVLSFFRTRSPILQQYFLYDEAVNRIEYVTDLGVIFSSDLTFTKHINSIITRAFTMLGFIKRNCNDFCDPLTLKILYSAFVRSVLEYASPVWSPFYQCHSERIESVQKQFVLYALRRLPSARARQFVLPPYQDRINLLGLQRLDYRREVSSIIFVRDLICMRVCCAELLARLNIYVPERRLRPRDVFFQINSVPTNHGLSEPVLSMSRLFNSVSHVFDFNISRDSFRKLLYSFYLNV
jgi:hypothetical protein